jgi:SEC-C motif-containing protein
VSTLRLLSGDDAAATGQTGSMTSHDEPTPLTTRPDGRPWPTTAEALMRSRFEAFRDADVAWLLASWHPSTRPGRLDLNGNPRWRGLQILDVVDGGEDDDTGIVEFRASYLTPGGVDFQHERSRFVREVGRWCYLDAVRAPGLGG